MNTLSATSKVLIAGCGDLGTALAKRLQTQGHEVFAMRRNHTSISAGIHAINADVTLPSSLQSLTALAPEYLVYCVSAGGQSDDQYRAIYVDGLRNVLNALAPASSLNHVFFVSSTRVYGQLSETLLDETTPAMPNDFGGERLLQGEDLLSQLSCTATALRFSGIYGANRTRMLRLAADPTQWPTQNTWSNRIHRDDGAAFIAYLMQQLQCKQSVEECYILTDSQPTPQYEVLMWLAQQMQVNSAQVAIPTVQGGKRLSNARMLQTGFKLRYPDYRAGYGEMLREDD